MEYELADETPEAPASQTVIDVEYLEDSIDLSPQAMAILSEVYNKTVGAKETIEAATKYFAQANEAFNRELGSIATFHGFTAPHECQFAMDFMNQKMVVKFRPGGRRVINLTINKASPPLEQLKSELKESLA